MYYGKGFPATVSSGFSKSLPVFGKAVSPFGKGFGKPFFGKPFYGKGFGFPATKAGGFSSVVPATTVKTTPFPGAI